jgi:hypothetical protein
LRQLSIIVLLLVLGWFCLLYADQTANSLPFSGSYLLRAHGTDALYWNPASLNPGYQDIIIPGLNQAAGLANSSFDLDTYNYISGRYLTESDKEMLLGKIDASLRVNTDVNITLFGMTFGNIALATSTHGRVKGRLAKDYLKIVLYGNEENDYTFTKKDNQVSALAYQDITLGIGNWDISQYVKGMSLPKIYLGGSLSALIGGGIAETQKYKGSLHSDIDGMILKQDIFLRTGLGGWGAKGLIGIKSEPMTNLSVGMSFDNIGGFINWVGEKKVYHYQVESDSIFVSDLDEDFVTEVDSSWAVGNFTTTLPLEMRLGALYQYHNANVSLDYVQGFADSQVTSEIGYFDFGVEYLPIPQLPLQCGYKPGNIDIPWSISYGIGFRGKSIDFGLGVQSVKAIIPGNKATGVTFSSSFSIHY